jgi:hypothetical protein
MMSLSLFNDDYWPNACESDIMAALSELGAIFNESLSQPPDPLYLMQVCLQGQHLESSKQSLIAKRLHSIWIACCRFEAMPEPLHQAVCAVSNRVD